MRMVYICSPYRAKDGAELDRHIEYAQALTKQAIEAGLAPITPHLYMTQCLNEDKPQERAAGMAAGLALLEKCDFVIAGVKYGISEGMSREIQTADALGIEVVNADKLAYKLEYEEKKKEDNIWKYVEQHSCDFCIGKLIACTLCSCKKPIKRAYKYAKRNMEKER